MSLLIIALIIWFLYKVLHKHNEDDAKKAYWEEVFRKAEYPDPDVSFILGEECYYGKGCEQNYEKAVEWYEVAASQGHAEA